MKKNLFALLAFGLVCAVLLCACGEGVREISVEVTSEGTGGVTSEVTEESSVPEESSMPEESSVPEESFAPESSASEPVSEAESSAPELDPNPGNDGTYYVYESDDFHSYRYIRIEGDTWTADDGVTGRCVITGNEIRYFYTLDRKDGIFEFITEFDSSWEGDTIELYSGTIGGGKLTIELTLDVDLGAAVFYLAGYAPEG